MGSRANRTVYVGNLPGDVREREVEDLFYKYGPIVDIDLKIPPRPPGYAFVEFEDARDAEDAIRGRDGYNFNGHRLRVELAHGGRGHSSSADRHSTHSGGGGTRGPSRRSDYRVLVTGLPSSASWQDLKDHMRRAGDVCFSQVFRDGRVDNANISISINPAVTGRTPEGVGIFGLPFTISALAVLKRRTLVLEGSIIANQAMQCGAGTTGIVDYTNYDDMKCAIKKLDDSEFRNAFTRAYIRVKEYDSRHSPSRSRSRSYSRSRSPSRSRSDNKSRSQSKSPKAKNPRRSPLRSRSRSVSSHSRSVSKERSLSRSRSRSRSHSPSPSRNKGASKSPRKRSPSRSRSLSR